MALSPSPTHSEHAHRPLKKNDLTALVTLVKPHDNFRSMVRSLATNTQNMDISWLLELSSGGTPPIPRLAIDNLAEDIFLATEEKKSPTTAVMLNSPRSVLASLRVGIPPMEVQKKPMSAFTHEPSGSLMAPEVADIRFQFYEDSRVSKLAILRKEYAAIKEEISADEIISFFTHYDPETPSAATKLKLTLEGGSGFFRSDSVHEEDWLKMKKERSRKAVEGQRKKIEKYLRSTLELKEKLKVAAEERARFEEDLARRRQEKKLLAEQKELAQKQKQQEWQEYLKQKEREHHEQVERRRQELARKEQARVESLTEAQEAKRQLQEETRRRHEARLQKNKDLQNSLLAERKELLEAKEKAAEEKRQQLEAFKMAEMEKGKQRALQASLHKKEILEMSVRRTKERVSQMQQKQQAAETRLQETQQIREHERMLDDLHADLLRQAKIEYVERQQRIRAFNQLRMIDGIQQKHDRIRKNEEQKQMILKGTLQEREELKMNKARLLQELARKYEEVVDPQGI